VEAVRGLVSKYPNLKLWFIGPGDSTWLRETVSIIGIEDHVIILPQRDDVLAIMACSAMVIHPSLADAFSQLVIEAQSVGSLLICTDIAAVREQVIENETALIIPPRDTNAIAKAIDLVLSNPAIGKKLKKNGPVHVRKTFTRERMIREQINLFQKVLTKYYNY
jgi:glycosyltransferase involved in cell wall biosynthesis